MQGLQNALQGMLTVQGMLKVDEDERSSAGSELSVNAARNSEPSELAEPIQEWVRLVRQRSSENLLTIEPLPDLRSATDTARSVSSIASSDQRPWDLSFFGKAKTAIEKTTNALLQTQFLSPIVPEVLLEVVNSGVDTSEHWREADVWRRGARNQVENAPKDMQDKLNNVIEQFDGTHRELASIFSKQTVVIHNNPTFNGNQQWVEVRRGARREIAGDLVRFIRATDVRLGSVVKSLQSDFESNTGLANLYTSIGELKAALPRLNFLKDQPVDDTMDYQKTLALVESLKQLPVWLASFRSSYKSMESVVANRFDGSKGGTGVRRNESGASLETVRMGDRMTVEGAVYLDTSPERIQRT